MLLKIVGCCILLFRIIVAISPDLSVRFALFQKCVEAERFPNGTDLICTKTSNPLLYNRLNHQWNTRIPHIDPLGYFIPRDTKDVQLAVKCGCRTNIPVIPKSGGHCFEKFSFGSSKTIIIDFSKMIKIGVDQKKQTARIQPGALVGEVYAKLWKFGGFGLPMGECFTVGMGGHVIGGGYGYFANAYGLTLDHLVEIEMVDANGFVHTVNASKNSNLFWALRGVGSGYIGIVTSFKFKLFKASNIQVFTVTFSYNTKYTAEALWGWQQWMDWTTENARTVHSRIHFTRRNAGDSSGGGLIFVEVVDMQDKSHSQSERNDVLMKNIREIFPHFEDMKENTFSSYLDFTTAFGSAEVISMKKPSEIKLEDIRQEISRPQYFRHKTFHVKKSFDKKYLDGVAAVLKRNVDPHAYVTLYYEGGAIHDVPPRSTAYIHRNSVFSVVARYDGPNDEAHVTAGWNRILDVVKAMKEMDSGNTYQNYVDLDLKDYLKRYYGGNLKRLISTKHNLDPTNYFQNPQSLPIL